jgi:hypothetical protein
MTWMSFYAAPVVFSTMLPFWFLFTLWQGVAAGMPARKALWFAAGYAPFAAAMVWVLLFVLLLGLIGGVHSW